MTQEKETYAVVPELRRPDLRRPDLVEADADPLRDEQGWILLDHHGRVIHGD